MTSRTAATLAVAFALGGCHRTGDVSLQEIDAQVRAMERAAVERTLLSLFPDREGWIILPGVTSARRGASSWFLEAYRVVAPDSLPADSWTRFVRGGERVELVEVNGSIDAPMRTEPAGFRGLMVSFVAAGVEAHAVLVDQEGMRWVLWYEAVHEGTDSCPDSIALRVAASLAGSGRPPSTDGLSPGCRFYPPVPDEAIPPESLLTMARRGEAPRPKWLPHGEVIVPDITIGRRLVFAAPPDPLHNLEPFLLQRRLDAIRGPRIVLSRTRSDPLPPGTYLWAVSTQGQARAIRVGSASDESLPCAGHSVVFFGRPVRAAGTLRVAEGGGMEADAFPGEYGLSPFVARSAEAARAFGTLFFPRLGMLLTALPGPDEGASWPALRGVAASSPCVWAPSPHGVR